MDLHQSVKHAFEAGTYVRLTVIDGDHEGFIVGLSETFVLLQAIHEWQDVGALVVPLDRLEACDVSDFHEQQLKILAFNSVKRTKRYAWVKLDSMEALFAALQPRGKFIVVSREDEADVGLIEAVLKDRVDLKAIEPGGDWIDEVLDCPYDEITLVQFDDSYSRVLQRYVERASTMN